MATIATMAIIARTRHYGHGWGGKVVVVTRKLGGVGAEPTIVSPFHNSTSSPGLSSKHTIRNRDVLQCSVSSVQAAPCLAQFLTVLGRTKIMQVVGRGREGGGVRCKG